MENNIKNLFPSEEMPWLKSYVDGAREESVKPAEQIGMWRFIERALKEQGDQYPAIEYFGRKIKRSELIAKVWLWARTLRGMGVGPDDRVIIFIPFIPEAAYIIFALNLIGAWPVMLNMGSSPEALAAGSKGAKFGVIADAVEENMAHVFRNSKEFEHVLFLSIGDQMPFYMKALVRLKTGKKNRDILKQNSNYISAADAIRRWGSFDGEVEAEFDPERPAIVTSSGGTSSKGYAKQIMDSNRAVISMFMQVLQTPLRDRYQPGTICYTGLPPFVSTCIFCLFLSPLYRNMTCYMEPRFDSKVFTKTIFKAKPQICLTPGRCWVYFFTQVERMLASGKKVDLSFFRMPIMGGEGCTPEDLRWMNSLMRKCGSPVQLMSGYGMSEIFSLLTADCRYGYPSDNDSEPVVSVGTPMPGTTAGVFDKDGNELPYGCRGELCIKATTLMLGYYNDEARTKEAIRDGWYHSGDLASIGKDGQIYVYCRMDEKFKCDDGTDFFPIDLELKMNSVEDVHCSMVNNMAAPGEKPRLAAHVVLYHECEDREAVIRKLDTATREILPDGLRIEGFKIHRHIFRMSNVCKTDRNSYKAELTGYFRPEGDRLVEVSFN